MPEIRSIRGAGYVLIASSSSETTRGRPHEIVISADLPVLLGRDAARAARDRCGRVVSVQRVQSVSIDIKALGDEASARLLVGGLPALHDWIEETEDRLRDRRIFIVDQTGEDIRKLELPSTYRNYVERLRDTGFLGKELIPSRRDDPLLLTPLFTDRDGHVYTLMVSRQIWRNLLFAPDVNIVLLATALLLSVLGVLAIGALSQPAASNELPTSARWLAAGNMEARVGQEFSQRRDELGVLGARLRHDGRSRAQSDRVERESAASDVARAALAAGAPARRDRSARRPGANLGRQLDRIELEAERLDTTDRPDPAAFAPARRADAAARAARPYDAAERDHRGCAARGRRGGEERRLGGAGRSDDGRRRSRAAAQRDRERAAQRGAVHQAFFVRAGAGGSHRSPKFPSSSTIADRACPSRICSGFSSRFIALPRRAIAIPAAPGSVSPSRRASCPCTAAMSARGHARRLRVEIGLPAC